MSAGRRSAASCLPNESRTLGISVLQDYLQPDVTKSTAVKQPSSFLDQHLLAVTDLDKPAIFEFLCLGSAGKAHFGFLNEVWNLNKGAVLFENPVGNDEGDLVRP